MTNQNIKEYIEIMEEIDHLITTNPKYRLQYIEYLDREIERLNDELAVEGIPRKNITPFEVAMKKGLTYIEFDEQGRLKNFWVKGKAKDFRRR